MIHRRLLTLIICFFLPMSPLLAEVSIPPGIRTIDATPASNFTLTDMDGNRFTLADHRGQWVFVHFWASWCGPCRKEMPAIQNMNTKLGGKSLAVVMINTAEDEDAVFSFLAAFAPDMSSVMDRDGEVTEAWQPRGLPATWLVDPEGNIRYQAIGGREWDQPKYIHFLENLSAH